MMRYLLIILLISLIACSDNSSQEEAAFAAVRKETALAAMRVEKDQLEIDAQHAKMRALQSLTKPTADDDGSNEENNTPAHIWGSVYQVNPMGDKPLPLSTYEIRLYQESNGQWLTPGLTDRNGRYAFRGLESGNYILTIYQRGNSWMSQIWQQRVQAPSTVEPIVLEPVLDLQPRVDYEPVPESSDQYRFILSLLLPEEQKDAIEKVVYAFDHEVFTEKTLIASGDSPDFTVTYQGWACSRKVTISVVHKTGKHQELNFDMCSALKNKPEA